ncbi:hypothetical protein, partial [Dietzia sp. 179-F 9C3 NHS]|uniref:hypothetical protein n=1 Tax=Dietzia sp. 179-F 9C3 NHS TaxID=3374295 RepID=UPI0038796CBB
MSTKYTKAASIAAASALVVAGAQGVSSAQLSDELLETGSSAALQIAVTSTAQGGGSLDPASLEPLSSASAPGSGQEPIDTQSLRAGSGEVERSVEGSLDRGSSLPTPPSGGIPTNSLEAGSDALESGSGDVEKSVSDSLGGDSSLPGGGSIPTDSLHAGSGEVEKSVEGSLGGGSDVGSVIDIAVGSLAVPGAS